LPRTFIRFVFLWLSIIWSVAGGSLPVAYGQDDPAAPTGNLPLNLAAIAIDVDAEGNLSVQGRPLAQYSGLLGADLTNLKFNPEWVEFLVANKIQHLQINNLTNELLILANGQPVPSIRWSDDSLLAIQETLDLVGAELNPSVEELITILGRIRIGVIIRLPVTDGTPPIPLQVTGPESAAEVAGRAQTEFIETVGQPARIHATLAYGLDGGFQIAGLSGVELAQLGLPLQALFTLAPGTVKQLSDMGVQSITFTTNAEGVFLAINGRTLPHVTWDQGKLQHLLNLVAQSEFFQTVGTEAQRTLLLTVAEQLLPMLQVSNLRLTITFP
jgi:sulfur carrier protein ThiS